MCSIISNKQNEKSSMNSLKINTAKRGNMKYRTCFSSVSYHGYKLDVLKSGMQKYLRRREFEKMTWCVMEIFKFELCSETELEKKMCKGIISNLLNRIIVMMDEELLFCEVQNYLLLRKFIEKFEDDRENGGKFLVLICRTLTNSRLLRRASDIRAFWDFRIRFGDEKNVELSVQEYFNKFVECFEKKDDECFKWMFKIFNGKRKGDKVRFRRKDNIYMIWEYLFSRENVKRNERYKELLEYKLREFYKLNRGERFMFLANSIDLVMKCDGKETIFVNVHISQICQELSRYQQDFVEMYKKNMEYLQIDDYAIDMHTSEGRKRGKNRKDFALEGCVVVREDTEFLVKEWRDFYIKEKLDNPVRSKKKRWEGKKKVEKNDIKKAANVLVSIKNMSAEKKVVKKKKGKTDRVKLRAEKYKRIKKMRGKSNFDDLEKDLEFIDSKTIDVNKIRLCSDMTCGNKVMCFEYEGKIWKEGRKSMNYNRDYCVLDECKELFGLEKIGMKRITSNFRIEKEDKNKKSWIDNWKMVSWGPCVGDNKDVKIKVVYCVMDKIEPGIEIGKAKELLKDRKILKEFVKIGVFRGIFRVSDFNGRNVLIKDGNKLVSIDEGDIGKRLDILGGNGKHKWLIKALNRDKSIIKEIIDEVLGKNETFIWKTMKKYMFSDDLCYEVKDNMRKLIYDLQQEGVEVEF